MSATKQEDRRYTVYCRRYDQNDRVLSDEELGNGELDPMTHKEACKYKWAHEVGRKGYHYYVVELSADEVAKRFEQAKSRRDELEATVNAASSKLKQLSGGGPMGLTPDQVKQSPTYQEAKAAYDRAFARLQNFNKSFVRTFARELREERRKREKGKV